MPSVSAIGPGAMPHDADAEPPPLDGEVPRDRVDAGLRGRRVDLQRRAVVVERRADVEDRAPSPAFCSASNAAREALKVPLRSMSITVRKPFGDSAAAGARKLPAAPLTSVSSLPNRSTVARDRASRSRPDRGRPRRRRARRGRSSAASSRRRSRRARPACGSTMQTSAPKPRVGGRDPAADAGATTGDERHVAGQRAVAEHVERTWHRRDHARSLADEKTETNGAPAMSDTLNTDGAAAMRCAGGRARRQVPRGVPPIALDLRAVTGGLSMRATSWTRWATCALAISICVPARSPMATRRSRSRACTSFDQEDKGDDTVRVHDPQRVHGPGRLLDLVARRVRARVEEAARHARRRGEAGAHERHGPDGRGVGGGLRR